jgi:hypothetical protein
MKFRYTVVIAAAALGIGLAVRVDLPAAAAPATATASLPSYCTAQLTTIRAYSITVDPGDNVFRSGEHNHGKLLCITLDVGNYQKTIEFNPATGGYVIPKTGLGAWYFNCGPPYQPPFRWSSTGLPYNDCAEEYTKTVTTPDGGLMITWPFYNGSPMYPPTTP